MDPGGPADHQCAANAASDQLRNEVRKQVREGKPRVIMQKVVCRGHHYAENTPGHGRYGDAPGIH
jgi:hypothetical protein